MHSIRMLRSGWAFFCSCAQLHRITTIRTRNAHDLHLNYMHVYQLQQAQIHGALCGQPSANRARESFCYEMLWLIHIIHPFACSFHSACSFVRSFQQPQCLSYVSFYKVHNSIASGRIVPWWSSGGTPACMHNNFCGGSCKTGQRRRALFVQFGCALQQQAATTMHTGTGS